jgi:hypothetical protein
MTQKVGLTQWLLRTSSPNMTSEYCFLHLLGHSNIIAIPSVMKLHIVCICRSWAARYYTGFLTKLMPQGVVFSFLHLSLIPLVHSHLRICLYFFCLAVETALAVVLPQLYALPDSFSLLHCHAAHLQVLLNS